MATGRVRKLAPWLLLGLVSTGCSQSNPFTSRQTMNGTLKASVSQLEYDNEKLKKEVAELKSENSRLATDLAQEEAANGEISARLDDAKELIRRNGGNAQALGVGSTGRNYEDDDVPPPVATPRSRPMKGTRKPPAAQIPQPPTDPTPFGSSNDGLGYRTSPRASRDLGDDDGEDNWLPVARGIGTQIR